MSSTIIIKKNYSRLPIIVRTHYIDHVYNKQRRSKIKKFFKPLIIITTLVILAGLWFIFCPAKYPKVKFILPTKGLAINAVYATGTVEATIMMPLSIRSTARLVELNAYEGSKVKKGELLARMEDNDLQKKLDELKAKMTYAEKDYKRRKALVKKGYETKAVLDESLSLLDSAKASVARAKAEADLMKIISPADGKVIRRDGEIGQVITANQPVFWISCCAPLRISAEVDEEDIVNVKIGQEVIIQADAFPNRTFSGVVQSITPKGDPIMRSFRVRIKFNKETPLQIGMTTESNIIISKKKDAILIPNNVINNKNKVFVIKNDILEKRTLILGAKGAVKTEVIKGLSVKDKIAITNNIKLKDKEKVRASMFEKDL